MKKYTVTIHFAGVSYSLFCFDHPDHAWAFIQTIPRLKGYVGFSCESEDANGKIETGLFKIKLEAMG